MKMHEEADACETRRHEVSGVRPYAASRLEHRLLLTNLKNIREDQGWHRMEKAEWMAEEEVRSACFDLGKCYDGEGLDWLRIPHRH